MSTPLLLYLRFKERVSVSRSLVSVLFLCPWDRGPIHRTGIWVDGEWYGKSCPTSNICVLGGREVPWRSTSFRVSSITPGVPTTRPIHSLYLGGFVVFTPSRLTLLYMSGTQVTGSKSLRSRWWEVLVFLISSVFERSRLSVLRKFRRWEILFEMSGFLKGLL